MTSKDELKVESVLDLSEKVIPLWIIVFDQNPTRSYICVTKDKVLASVTGAISGTYGDDADVIIPGIINQIKKSWGKPFICLTCPSLSSFIHRLEIDKYNPIGKLLLECYDTITYDDLRARIAKLFINPS